MRSHTRAGAKNLILVKCGSMLFSHFGRAAAEVGCFSCEPAWTKKPARHHHHTPSIHRRFSNVSLSDDEMEDNIPFTGIAKGSEDQSVISEISERTGCALEGGGGSSNADQCGNALFNALHSRTLNGGNNHLDLLLSITLPIYPKPQSTILSARISTDANFTYLRIQLQQDMKGYGKHSSMSEQQLNNSGGHHKNYEDGRAS